MPSCTPTSATWCARASGSGSGSSRRPPAWRRCTRCARCSRTRGCAPRRTPSAASSGCSTRTPSGSPTRVGSLDRHFGQAQKDIEEIRISADRTQTRARRLEAIDFAPAEATRRSDDAEDRPPARLSGVLPARPRCSCNMDAPARRVWQSVAVRGRVATQRVPGVAPWRSSPSTTIPTATALANELHARPFPELTAPCRALHLAIMPAGERRRPRPDAGPGAPDRAARPLRRAAPGAGRQPLFRPARPRLPEMGAAHRVRHLHALRRRRRRPAVLGRDVRALPRRLAGGGAGPGGDLRAWCGSSAPTPDAARAADRRASSCKWFVPESLAVSRVVDGEAVIAGDFRIDEHGHSRFAVLARPGDRPAPARAHRAAAAGDRDLQVRWRC